MRGSISPLAWGNSPTEGGVYHPMGVKSNVQWSVTPHTHDRRIIRMRVG